MTNFSKQPISIPDQIALLKSRGLIIPDVARAERYLSNISYYRFSGYAKFFQVQNDPNHNFIVGTSFDDVLAYYLFDRKLRLLVFDAIERVEVSFRTALVNNLCVDHG